MIKTIILLIIIFTSVCNAQFTKYWKPILKADNHNYIYVPYVPPFYQGSNSYLLFYIDNGLVYKGKLKGGVDLQNVRKVYGVVDQILLSLSKNIWVGAIHRLYNPYYKYIFTLSTNYGNTWIIQDDTMYTGSKSDIRNSYVGEDITAMFNPAESEWNIYFRDTSTQLNLVRTVALTKTKDWLKFTDRIPIATNTNFNNRRSKFYRKSIYEFSVFKIESDWFAFAGVFQHREDMREDTPPPYSFYEHTLETFLYHSLDGENWTVCNDSVAVIPITSYRKQVLALPTFNGSYVFAYAIENPKRHNSKDTTPGQWELDLYYMEKEKFLNYIP